MTHKDMIAILRSMALVDRESLKSYVKVKQNKIKPIK